MLDDLESILRQDVLLAARRLLGCILVKGELRARIVETEAYRSDDPASHSYRGITPRTRVMFGPPGYAYVYFSYGNHWMLNVVAHEPGNGAAVLIRAAEPLAGLDDMRLRRLKARRDEDLMSGPGKLCAAFAITKSEDGIDLLHPRDSSSLRLEPSEPVADIAIGLRIGISVGKDQPWRFIDRSRLRWASRPHL